MAQEMTSRERIRRMFEHREADRVPIVETPWATTLERWEKEGVCTARWMDEMGIDRVADFSTDNSPRYPVKVLEETADYVISTTEWGVTLRNFKQTGSTPEFLDFTIKDLEKWHEARKRMVYDPSRIDWAFLKKNYPRWQKEGAWTNAHLWFGFDVTHSWMIGTEDLLVALIDDPDWVKDIYNTQLELSICLMEKVLDEGYTFDSVFWYDDLGYKNTQFFSLDTYREMSKPFHKRACDWAHERGMKVTMHSCGDVRPFVPEFIEVGVDCLNPLEVKAGMNPYQLKAQYGDQLVFWGGLSALEWLNAEKQLAEVERLVPVMMQNGGYIFATDHSVPENVGSADFKRVLDRVRELGRY